MPILDLWKEKQKTKVITYNVGFTFDCSDIKSFFDDEIKPLLEPIVTLIDGYYVDSNNNKWSESSYTKRLATEASKTLIECKNCIDCRALVKCIGCVQCEDCIECIDCFKCIECIEWDQSDLKIDLKFEHILQDIEKYLRGDVKIANGYVWTT